MSTTMNNCYLSKKAVCPFWLALLFFLLPSAVFSQSPQQLLEQGRQSYRNDQLDSALFYYDQAYRIDDPNIKIQAVEGQIKVAVLKTELEKADSLIRIGDELAENGDIDLKYWCEYKTAKGEYFRKNSQFEKALKQHQEVVRKSAGLQDGNLIHAYALYYTALTFERLSAYDSSLIYVDRAYTIFQQELDSTDIRFSNIYNGMGACYYRANRFEEAKQYYLKAKNIAEEKLGPVSSDLAFCLNNLSSISRAEENYEQAIHYSEQALKIFRALGDEQGVSSAYYALGVYHYFLGDYGRTKDYMEACIDIREKLFDPNHYLLIGPHEVLGIAHEESGDYGKTLHYLSKVRPKIKANYGSGSLVEGFNYENTAICFKNIGRMDSALHYIKKANRIIPNQLPSNDYSVFTHFFSYASILFEIDRLDEALSILKRSSRIGEALGLENSSEYAMNLALQGLIEAEKKNWTAAESSFQRALDRIRLSKEQELAFQLSPNTLNILHEYIQFLITKYKATADPNVLERFKDFSQLYLDLSDNFRKQFNDPYTKSVLIKDNARAYKYIIGMYAQLYRHTGQSAYLNAAFNFSEYGRTCLLRDLQDEKIQSYAGLPDSVLAKERSLRKEMSRLNQQLLEKPENEEVKKKLFASKEAFNDYVEKMLETHPKYYDLRFNSKMPGLEEIRTQLKERENLVEFMQDDTAYYALVINKNQNELLHLGSQEQVNQRVQGWKKAVISRDKKALDNSGHQLYRQLWRPLEGVLDGDRITIVPSGPLFYLNFEALPVGDSFLVHRYTITYALSLSVQFSSDQEKKDGPLIAIAPGFEEEIKKEYEAQLDSLELPDEDYLRTVRQPWSLKLAQKLKNKFTRRAYTGLEATESKIKDNIKEGKILYFGTHAIADPSDPLRSKLVLAKAPGEQQEDGYLHAYEIYGIPLQANLAVLNACESGLGELQEGEGMISLAYSIHYAGCPSTVMSLWKVDEKISTRITEDFLNNLAQGLSKSEALRQAKLDYLKTASPELQHPFYWAGMVLMGQDGEVELKGKSLKWPFFVGVGLLILMAVILGFRKKLK